MPKKKKTASPKKDYEVEEIRGAKTLGPGGKTFYLVKWVGWKKPQWEPEENVQVRAHSLLSKSTIGFLRGQPLSKVESCSLRVKNHSWG